MQEIILLLKMLQMLKDSKIILRSFDENNQLLGQSIAPFQYGQQALSMLRSLLTPQQFNEAYLQITEYIHQFQLDSLTLDLTVGGGSIEATPIIQLPETLTVVPHLQLTTHIDNSNEQIVTVTFVNADTLINMGGSLELSAYYSDEYGSTEPQIVASLQIQSNWDGTKELVVQKNRKFYVQQRHHRNGNYSQWSAYQSIKTQRTQTMPPMLRLYDESHPFTKIYQGQIISLKNPYLYGLPQGEFKKIEVSYELDGKILKKEIDTLMYTTDEQQPQQKVDVLVELRPNQSDITVYLTLTDTSDNTSTQLIVQNVQALPFSEQEKDIHDVIVDNRHRLNVMNQLDEWAGVIKNITPVDTDTYILRIENIAGTQDNGLIDNEGQIVVYHQLDNGQTYTSPYYIKSIELDSDNTKGTFTISQTGQFVQQVGDQVRITGSVNALHHSERYTVDGLVKSMQKHESHEIVLTLTNGTFELGSGNVLKIKGDNLNYQFDDYKNKPAQFVDLGYSQEIQTVGGRKFNSRVINKQNNILSVPLEDYKGESIVGSTVIIRSVDQFTQKQLIDEYNKLSSVIASNYFTEIYTGIVAAHQNVDGKQKFTLTLDQPYTGSLLTNLNLPTGLVLETTVYQGTNPLLTKYFNITKVEPTYVVCDRPIEYNEIFTTSCQPKFRILKPTDQLQSAITQTKDEISLAVKQIGGWQDQSPTTLGSQLSITANQIDMTVTYIDGEGTKHVSLQLNSDGTISMVGKHVDFQSNVTIHGDLLVEGSVDAQKITANTITAQQIKTTDFFTTNFRLNPSGSISTQVGEGGKTFKDSNSGVYLDAQRFELAKYESNSQNDKFIRADLQPADSSPSYIEIKLPNFSVDRNGAGSLQNGQLQWDQHGNITQNSLVANSVFQNNQTISQILTLGTDAVIVSEGTTYSVDTLPNGNARRINADSSGVLIDKTTLHLRNTSDQFANSEILFDTNDGTLNINMLKGSQTLNNTKLVKIGTYNGHQYEIQSFGITGDAVNITRTFNSNSTSDTLGIGELPDWYNPDAGSGTLQGLDPITQQSNKNHKLMLLLYEGKVQTDSNGNAEFDLPYHKFTVPELNNNRVSVDVNPTILNITPVNVNGDYIMAAPTIEQTITQSQDQPNGILNRIQVTSQQKKINTMQLNTQYVYPGLSVFQNHSNDTSTQDNHKRIGTNLYGYNYKTAFHGTWFYDSDRGNFQFNMNTSFQPSNSYSIATQQITNDRQIKQITLNFPGIGVDKVIELPNVVNTNSTIKVNVRYTVQEIGCYVESRNYLHIWWKGIIPYRITGQVVQPYIVVSVKVDSIQVNGSTVFSNIPIGSYRVNSTDPNFYNFADAQLVFQLNNHYYVPQISDYWILGKIITPSNVENAGKFRISQAMGVYSTPAPNCEAYVKVYYQL